MFPGGQECQGLGRCSIGVARALRGAIAIRTRSRSTTRRRIETTCCGSRCVLSSRGFANITFNAARRQRIRGRRTSAVGILLMGPFVCPRTIRVNYRLRSLRGTMNNSVRTACPFGRPITLIVRSRNGLMNGRLGHTLHSSSNSVCSVVTNSFLIIKLNRSSFYSLSPRLVGRFRRRFRRPRAFMHVKHDVVTLPLPSSVIGGRSTPIGTSSIPRGDGPSQSILWKNSCTGGFSS